MQTASCKLSLSLSLSLYISFLSLSLFLSLFLSLNPSIYPAIYLSVYIFLSFCLSLSFFFSFFVFLSIFNFCSLYPCSLSPPSHYLTNRLTALALWEFFVLRVCFVCSNSPDTSRPCRLVYLLMAPFPTVMKIALSLCISHLFSLPHFLSLSPLFSLSLTST